MFIRRREYDALIADRGRAHELDRQLSQQQTLISFLCTRLTAVEKERGAMFEKLTGVAIQTPTFMPAPPTKAPTDPVQMKDRIGRVPSIDDVVGPMGSVFDDMGDNEAEKAGIGWSRDGTVTRRSDQLVEKR